jgi:hypothetical protein
MQFLEQIKNENGRLENNYFPILGHYLYPKKYITKLLASYGYLLIEIIFLV